MSAPCPHGTETRSGVGRVARRARLAAKPYSRVMPRLTLKAGHKAGLPTTPLLAAALQRQAFPDSFSKTFPELSIFLSEYSYTEYYI